MSKTTQAV